MGLDSLRCLTMSKHVGSSFLKIFSWHLKEHDSFSHYLEMYIDVYKKGPEYRIWKLRTFVYQKCQLWQWCHDEYVFPEFLIRLIFVPKYQIMTCKEAAFLCKTLIKKALKSMFFKSYALGERVCRQHEIVKSMQTVVLLIIEL